MTRRQATTDAERRGGYASERIVSDTALNAEVASDVANESILRNTQPVENIKIQSPAEQEFKYTTREALVAPPVKEPAAELPPRPEKAKRPLEKDDIMPTLKTRSMLATPIEEDVAAAPVELNDAVPTRRERTQLSPKLKVMLFVYLAIALVLAIAVIATGVSISRTAAAADRLATEIAAKQNVIAAQTTEIAASTDPDAIRDEAISLGMTYAGDPAATAPTVGKVEYPTPTEHTNGFDGFCDWLSNVLM